MFLRKHAKRASFILLFCLLAWYSGEAGPGAELLVSMWDRTFYRIGADCVYWITMRLAAWIVIYLHLLRLESGFFVYLFLRQRSYGKVFLHTYAGCVGRAMCYYGIGTLIMAVFHSLTLPGVRIGSLLCQGALPRILAEEGLEALSFCLAAYAVHCVFRHAEAGFLVTLTGRLALNFATGGARPGLPVQLTVLLVLTMVVFFMAFRNFAEKYIDG
ncbi:MAG: hypothetical protein NC251_11435 [Lachnoclostridium sp.]|nr:hypothetical protein [Lachnospira sp.]MCM1249032.1 hypothetical protein [Lachnoclostridium sp.]MCM1535900.1 hypothetical protein [Clostridium sp.]